MDQVALVENQISDGKKLIDKLEEQHFDVAAACWINASEGLQWFLYIVSKLVDVEGPASAYRKLYSALQLLPEPWVSMSDVKLIGIANPISKDLIAILRNFVGKTPTRFKGSRLGNVSVEDAFIYPPLKFFSNGGPYSLGRIKLKKPIPRLPRVEQLLQRLKPEDEEAIERLVAGGMDKERAEYWVRQRRETEQSGPPIPSGAVVTGRVAAWWGDNPEDDPDPLVEVESDDGAKGLVRKSDTEPIS